MTNINLCYFLYVKTKKTNIYSTISFSQYD